MHESGVLHNEHPTGVRPQPVAFCLTPCCTVAYLPPSLPTTRWQVFDEHMPTPNQISRQRNDVQADAAALLAVPEGPRTQATLRNNIAVCIRYMAAWLGGTGCVPLYDLMEDAATAEISRAQVGGGVGGGGSPGCGVAREAGSGAGRGGAARRATLRWHPSYLMRASHQLPGSQR